MAAGANLKISIYKQTMDSDDAVGGAMITGTNLFVDIPARMNSRMPSQVSMEAGLEVTRIFDITMYGHRDKVNERDEIEVTWPLDSPYYGERFRVIGLQFDGRRSRYAHTNMTLRRIERSRARQ